MSRKTSSLHVSAPNFLNHEQALQGYFLALRASGRAEKTVTTYASCLKLLERFCADRGMPILTALSTEHLREFFNDLFQRGNKPSSISVRYRALQQFYKWLVVEGERQDNPLDRIPTPRVPEQLQPHYSDDDVRRVLAKIPPNSRDVLLLRNQAILLTLYDTGVRGSELCGVPTDDLDLHELSLRVRRAKGGRIEWLVYRLRLPRRSIGTTGDGRAHRGCSQPRQAGN